MEQEARIRLSEHEARTLLLIQAVEESDAEGVLLPTRARAAATRRAFDAPARSADDQARLRTRAALLRDDALREAPALARVLDPPHWRGPLVLATIAVAAVAGALTNLLGPERHVSVLAFPLAGILAWNMLVYAAVAARALGRTVARLRGARPAPSRLASLGRWLEDTRLATLARRLGATARSAVVTDAVRRFQLLWLPTAAPLIAARLRVVLHLAAVAMALGAVIGMYVSGIAFEYRATWESTWLDATAVQRYLDAVLGPAARVLGEPVPDVAPLRGSAGEGSAAPWIHLWATTLGLFVLIPRAILAAVDALTAARLSRWLLVHVDAGYARRALHSGRGAATLVHVVYYSCAPDTALRERLHSLLQEHAGARAVIHDDAHLDYGDRPERVTVPEAPSGSGLLVVVFALAQTPETQVHGEFLERLAERLEGAGWTLMVIFEAATFRVDREHAMGALFDRVQAATRRLMDRLIELHQLSGESQVLVERRLEDATVQGHEAINPTTGAIAGGAVSGLLTGLGADALTGGLSLGGGAIVGAMLGALGGYAFGGAYRLATGAESGVQFQPAALDRLAREAVLRYLLVAHHGRGRGDYADVDFPEHWAADVEAQWSLRREELHGAWRDAARAALGSAPAVAERLRPVLRALLRDLLRARFPDATVLSEV